jgi:hypothetical protein
MTILPSLRQRVFLASALVAIASVAVATQFVTARVTREAEAELRRGLAASAELLERHHAARLETLTSMARLVADLPKLKAAVATGDAPTVEPVARDYQTRVRSDVFIVTGAGGRPLASLGARNDSSATAEALAGSEAITFQEDGGRLLEVVTVPIAIGLTPWTTPWHASSASSPRAKSPSWTVGACAPQRSRIGARWPPPRARASQACGWATASMLPSPAPLPAAAPPR